MKHTRMIAAVLCAAMAVSAAPLTVSSAGTEGKHIVVIGDTISTNANLADEELSYAELLDGYLSSAEITSFAQEGYTTADVLQSLEQADVQAALADADMILVSAGMHDVMDAFIARANHYKEEFGFEQFSDLFTAKASDIGLSDSKLVSIGTELTNLVKENGDAVEQNIYAIGEKLTAYPDAQIICINAYDCMNTIENYDSLSPLRKMGYDTITNSIDETLDYYVNYAYNALAENYSYTIIDTYTMFDGQAYIYSYPEQLKVNPTPLGHEAIAFAVADAAQLLQTGDVNGDGAIDAADAAAVLSHATDIGAGGKGIFNALQAFVANVTNPNNTADRDQDIDATDAAIILTYAALAGAGETPSFEELIN